MAIDIIDQKLLEVLQEDARVSISEISKKINLSLSAVSERLKKLEQSGVIKRYTAILDEKEMDKSLAAIVMIAVENSAINELAKIVNENNDIISCQRIMGEYDYILKLAAKDQASLQSLIDKIKALKGITKESSSLVLSDVKMNYSVPPLAKK